MPHATFFAVQSVLGGQSVPPRLLTSAQADAKRTLKRPTLSEIVQCEKCLSGRQPRSASHSAFVISDADRAFSVSQNASMDKCPRMRSQISPMFTICRRVIPGPPRSSSGPVHRTKIKNKMKSIDDPDSAPKNRPCWKINSSPVTGSLHHPSPAALVPEPGKDEPDHAPMSLAVAAMVTEWVRAHRCHRAVRSGWPGRLVNPVRPRRVVIE